MNLEDIFKEIHEQLDEMNEAREEILKIQRKVVQQCSVIIKDGHRDSFETIELKISATLADLMKLKDLIENASTNFPKDYYQIAAQEYGEAIILYNLIKHNKYIPISETNLEPRDYAYALADVVGELRRMILKKIRQNKIKRSFTLFDEMENIYEYLFLLDYPGGLIPGLRHKVDVARNLVAKTEGELTLSAKISELNQKMEN